MRIQGINSNGFDSGGIFDASLKRGHSMQDVLEYDNYTAEPKGDLHTGFDKRRIIELGTLEERCIHDSFPYILPCSFK